MSIHFLGKYLDVVYMRILECAGIEWLMENEMEKIIQHESFLILFPQDQGLQGSVSKAALLEGSPRPNLVLYDAMWSGRVPERVLKPSQKSLGSWNTL